MNHFSAFLKESRTKRGFASSRELFESWGGSEKLGMSLRNFQLMEAGKQDPSPKAFLAIFRQLEREDYKESVLAFFASGLADQGASAKPLLDYLRDHLTPAYKKTEMSIWESERPQMTYSEEQLELLTRNPEAMRLHHRLLLKERVSLRELEGRDGVVAELERLSLATRTSTHLESSRSLFRLPNYENAAPSAVRKATRYLLKHTEVYASEEGSERQELSYALQMVTPNVAKQIIEEMKKVKKWIQSIASVQTEGDLVPFVFVAFGKRLDTKEFS